MHWLFWFIPPASFNQTCSLVQMYQQLIGCYENPVTRLHEYFKSDNQSLWKVQLRQTSQLTGSLTSTAPSPPRLRGKLMNFLWIVVDCVSPRANAQLGFNDLSLLFESMPLLHPRHTLQICCVLSVSPARSDLSFSVLLLFFSPSSQVGCGFCVRPPLASCGWWAVTLIAFLLWSLPKTHRPSRALQTVLTQFYTGPLCEEISWARSFHLVSLWLVSVHHSLSAKVIMLKALLTFIFIQNL